MNASLLHHDAVGVADGVAGGALNIEDAGPDVDVAPDAGSNAADRASVPASANDTTAACADNCSLALRLKRHTARLLQGG